MSDEPMPSVIGVMIVPGNAMLMGRPDASREAVSGAVELAPVVAELTVGLESSVGADEQAVSVNTPARAHAKEI